MRILTCLLLIMGLGCGDDDGETDAGTDTGVIDASADSGSDGGADAGTDAGDDAATDAGEDAAVDAVVDAVADAVADAFDADIMDCSASTLRFESPLPQMTNGSGDDFNPVGGCVGAIATGPDRVYALVPSLGAGTYRVTATPVSDDWNPMIYVITDCTGETCLAGTNLNGVGEADSLDITVAADQVVYVVVDTALDGNIDGGPFMLSTELL